MGGGRGLKLLPYWICQQKLWSHVAQLKKGVARLASTKKRGAGWLKLFHLIDSVNRNSKAWFQHKNGLAMSLGSLTKHAWGRICLPFQISKYLPCCAGRQNVVSACQQDAHECASASLPEAALGRHCLMVTEEEWTGMQKRCYARLSDFSWGDL